MIKKYLTSVRANSTANATSTGLLLLRLMLGGALMVHGFGKIQTPFAWMPPEAPIPGILQFLAAFSEFFGGLAMILGLLTSLASLGIIVTMAVAAFFHISKGDGFVQGYELALVYLVIALSICLMGPGKYSLDMKVFGTKA